jgi:hypothetical protein
MQKVGINQRYGFGRHDTSYSVTSQHCGLRLVLASFSIR